MRNVTDFKYIKQRATKKKANETGILYLFYRKIHIKFKLFFFYFFCGLHQFACCGLVLETISIFVIIMFSLFSVCLSFNRSEVTEYLKR